MNAYDGIPYERGEDGVGRASAVGLPLSSVWGADRNEPERPDSSEPIVLVKELSRLGLKLVNVTAGNPYANPHVVRPFEYSPVDGYETPEHPLVGVARHFGLAGAIQGACPDVAVVGSGYSWLQSWIFQAGAANLRDGRASFVGVGRGSLSQPDFARHVIEGRPLDPKRLCRTFSYCTALMRAKHNDLGQFAAGCPPFDKDVYGPIWKEAQDVPTKG